MKTLIEDAGGSLDLKSKRILIVDDDPAIIQVLCRLFRDKECLVRSASNAADAILLSKENRFDLILLDINMPGASGFSAIKTLKSMSDAVILVMSGLADEEIRKDALLLGAAEMIAKPFEHQQLMSLIQAGLARRCDAPR